MCIFIPLFHVTASVHYACFLPEKECIRRLFLLLLCFLLIKENKAWKQHPLVIQGTTDTTRRIFYHTCLLHTTHTISPPSESTRDQIIRADLPSPLAWIYTVPPPKFHAILSILSVHRACSVQSWSGMTKMVLWMCLSSIYKMCFTGSSRLEIRWYLQRFKKATWTGRQISSSHMTLWKQMTRANHRL